jgi:hypothetical protein
MEVGLTWGRKNAPFIFPSPTTDAGGAWYAHGKRLEIALLNAAKQVRAARATGTNHLWIQGNLKPDFLE